MVSKEFFLALEELAEKKHIDKGIFIETLESALTAAYKKNFNEASNAMVKLDEDKKTLKFIKYKVVVENVIDSDKEITLMDAKKIKKSYKIGDRVEEEVAPKDFGRIAIQTAKQVVMQKMRELEKEYMLKDLSEKIGLFISTKITRIDGDNVFVRLDEGILEGVMGRYDQIPGEKYRQNDTIKVYVRDLKDSPKGGPTVLVTRANTIFIQKLLELQIPEIANGEIEIVNIAREAGMRTKVAIRCLSDETDPVGACVGNRSMRINSIINELNGEKVDIVLYSDDPKEYLENALSPATVDRIEEDGEGYTAYVPNNKLSLAIGKGGVNVKLAAKLTGIKINIEESKDYTEMIDSKEEVEEEVIITEEDEGTTDIEDLFADEV